MNKDRYARTIQQIYRDHERRLLELGAIDMISGRNFVAYVREEANGRLSGDVWRWGVNHGKVAFADSIEDLTALLYAVYDPKTGV